MANIIHLLNEKECFVEHVEHFIGVNEYSKQIPRKFCQDYCKRWKL